MQTEMSLSIERNTFVSVLKALHKINLKKYVLQYEGGTGRTGSLFFFSVAQYDSLLDGGKVV